VAAEDTSTAKQNDRTALEILTTSTPASAMTPSNEVANWPVGFQNAAHAADQR
jgi:hypothetical protein